MSSASAPAGSEPLGPTGCRAGCGGGLDWPLAGARCSTTYIRRGLSGRVRRWSRLAARWRSLLDHLHPPRVVGPGAAVVSTRRSLALAARPPTSAAGCRAGCGGGLDRLAARWRSLLDHLHPPRVVGPGAAVVSTRRSLALAARPPTSAAGCRAGCGGGLDSPLAGARCSTTYIRRGLSGRVRRWSRLAARWRSLLDHLHPPLCRRDLYAESTPPHSSPRVSRPSVTR